MRKGEAALIFWSRERRRLYDIQRDLARRCELFEEGALRSIEILWGFDDDMDDGVSPFPSR